jgi:prolyl-tRNA editing enzyme YbaK/EbsC (Cys-tRNA(Pro) deacylase)
MSSTTIHELKQRYDQIEKQIHQLEQATKSKNPHLTQEWEHDTTDVKRVKQACIDLKLNSAKLHKVPTNYYKHTLDGRREILNAPSIHHLCKSMIVENSHCVNDDCSNKKNSRFYCIVMQYSSKLSSDKIMRYLRDLNDNQLGKRKFYFRLAYEQDQSKLTGYKFNAVAPIGMLVDVPIIVSKRIVDELQPCKIYLGGGEVDVKLEVDVHEFIRATGALVADVTDVDADQTGSNVIEE